MNLTHFFRLLALYLLVTATPAVHAQQIPTLLNYQGRIQTGTPPVDFTGVGQFKFALVAGTANISVQAVGTAVRTGGVISSISVNSQNYGYFSPPVVTITGGGGSGAAAVAVVGGGRITAINVVQGGGGYTSTPTVSIPAPAPRQEFLWVNSGGLNSDPSASVGIPVTSGLYSVQLGDTTLSNMSSIPATVFAREDVRLRVWFNGTQLSPDQRLAPVSYLSDQLAGNIHFQDSDLFFRSGTDQNHGIGYYGDGRNFGTVDIPGDGPVVYGYDGGALGSNFVGIRSVALTWRRDGRVTIGTLLPKQAKLTVSGTGGVDTLGNHYFYGSSGVSSSQGHSLDDVSIYAERWVNGEGFRAFSDARIKNITGRSDSAADLRLLQQIEITDYTPRDTVAKGTRSQKKVIAQQVEKVYPAAVGHSRGVVPDIFQKAPVNDGWVMLKTSLNKGERVRLLGEKSEGIQEVLEVRDGAFRPDRVPQDGEVFVYGREVDDFRTVDYEAIAMLNVSATQQLKKDHDAAVDSLRRENTALRDRLAALEAREARMNTLLEKLGGGTAGSTAAVTTKK